MVFLHGVAGRLLLSRDGPVTQYRRSSSDSSAGGRPLPFPAVLMYLIQCPVPLDNCEHPKPNPSPVLLPEFSISPEEMEKQEPWILDS